MLPIIAAQGRLNGAIRKARSKNFWKLRKHLPTETQHYVPKYIAVVYVMNYYLFHDLRPIYPDYDLQLTEVMTVYKRTSLKEIALETGIPQKLIEHLNPVYRRKVIPPNKEGYLVVLPQMGLAKEVEVSHLGEIQKL